MVRYEFELRVYCGVFPHLLFGKVCDHTLPVYCFYKVCAGFGG